METSVRSRDNSSSGHAAGSGNSKAASSSRRGGNRRGRRGGSDQHLQRFSDYLVFGFQSTMCLACFALCYVLVLITLWPLLLAQEPSDLPEESASDYLHHPHVPPSIQEAHLGDHLGEMAGAMKKRLERLKQGRGVTDAALLEQANVDFQQKKQEKKEQQSQQAPGGGAAQQQQQNLRGGGDNNSLPVVAGGVSSSHRTGFMVLGMHRSGTSMLSGLLHTSCGYTVGGPLIGSAFDNEKGFFELVDIVLQNDEFMNNQRVYWSANAINYDWQRALTDKDEGRISFQHGAPGLKFLNDPANAPWLQKDPRMCITLKTWLPLMNNEPAIVFTYRHPLEVAMSLKKREQDFELERGLRLWIVYNMRAIQNSKGLCMVKSSNDAILADPLNEVQRISDELTNKCNVPQPPNRVSQEDVDKFVDPNLQHNAKRRAESEQNREVIAEYNGGKCKVYSYDSELQDGDPAKEREQGLYASAMKVYCDFQSGKAYEDNYEWPRLA